MPVDAIRPGAKGLDLTVKVLETKVVLEKKLAEGKTSKIVEALVGDSTGVVIFKARNDQADKTQPGAYITLKNAKVDMYRGSMRLEVDASGSVEEASGSFQPKTDNNLSLIEFELVSVTGPETA